MKFKVQDKQNQLIGNITVHHLIIGVDNRSRSPCSPRRQLPWVVSQRISIQFAFI